MESPRRHGQEPIAIIGLSLKFPQQASTPAAFWNLLVNGISARTEVPADRYNAKAFYDGGSKGHIKPGNVKTKHGHFISESLDRFDAPFFSISPHEAECMDPQQRLLLETTYHALENAGLPIDKVHGSNTSVFVGCFMNDHETMVRKDLGLSNTYHATGTSPAILSNRLSWFYNFKGPSMSINTACSSSLVALHLACESLRSGETTMGVVCGTNLLFTPEGTAGLSNLNFLSPDGICYAFDERANGYARGEGMASIIIKPLSAAIRDNDTIRAVVRGTGVNSDGRTPGITQPSYEAQVSLIRSVYDRFDLDMSQTRYFEAHGTGTQLGDSLEAKAIATAFYQRGTSPLFVGTVKSNIGHLEGASGLAGLIKAMLVLENKLITPNIWLDRINPSIKDEWGLSFPTKATPFPGDTPRRASVNSFGFGGTNAHAVLDAAESFNERDHQKDLRESRDGSSPPAESTPSSAKLFVWSAADERGIDRLNDSYRLYFQNRKHGEGGHDPQHFENLVYTLSYRRSHLSWRSFSICDSPSTSLDCIPSEAIRVNSKLQICYVFTGQGAQWVSMGQELLSYDAFQRSLEESDTLLGKLGCQFSVLEKLYGPKESASPSELDLAEFCQPICTAVQIALVELLTTWGIKPLIVVGHSSGEVAAAYCAGIISKLHALRVAFLKGVAVAAASQIKPQDGAMLAVRLSLEKCQESISRLETDQGVESDALQIACHNSPQSVTVSGSKCGIDQLRALLGAEGVMAKVLNVGIAYHNSQHMHETAQLYQSLLEESLSEDDVTKTPATLKCCFVSSYDGKEFEAGSIATEHFNIDYWINNLVSPVRFTKAVENIAFLRDRGEAISDTYFLEVGPHNTLKSAIREIVPKEWSLEQGYSSLLSRNQPARRTAMTVAGKLHCLGYPVNLTQVNQISSDSNGVYKCLNDLPQYPFDHSKKHWLESRTSINHRFRKVPHNDFLGLRSLEWNPFEPEWNNRITLQEAVFVKDHKIAGAYLYPAAGMLVMAIEAVRQTESSERKCKGYRFQDVNFTRSLMVPESREGVETQFRLREVESPGNDTTKRYEFSLYVHEHAEWTRCCHGFIQAEYICVDPIDHRNATEEYGACLEACQSPVAHVDFYRHLGSSGLVYGPIFRNMQEINNGRDNRGIGTVDTQPGIIANQETSQSACLIHPAVLDSIIQVAYVGISQGGKKTMPTLVPTKVNELWISASGSWRIKNDSVVQVSTQAIPEGLRSHAVKYVSLRKEDERPFLIGNITFTSIGNAERAAKKRQDPILLYNVAWKPHVNLLTSDAHSVLLSLQHPELPPKASENASLMEYACYVAISNALSTVKNAEANHSNKPAHLQNYLDWMKHQISIMQNGDTIHRFKSLPNEDRKDPERLFKEIESIGAEGRLIAKISQVLPGILLGEVDPLGLLFEDETLAEYYSSENPPAEVSSSVQTYIDSLAHVHPDLRILEIGAGTGGMTCNVLNVLGGSHSETNDKEGGLWRFSEYMFTDISTAFFDAARKKFGREGFVCKTLNIEKDPEKQGFTMESYDVVIASNVLHATSCLATTVTHTRKLLKPGGKLILVEGTNPDSIRLSYIFGCLSGWWLSSEPFRKWGPLVATDTWSKLLRDNGFTGIDVVVDGANKEQSLSSMIVSTAAEDEANRVSPHLVVVTSEASPVQCSLAASIQDQCMGLSIEVSIADTSSAQRTTDAVCVFLETMDGFDFQNPSEHVFESIKRVVRNNKKILWVSRRCDSNADRFEQDGVLGLARSILSENEDLKLITLGLETNDNEEIAQHVLKVVQQYFIPSSDDSQQKRCEGILEVAGSLCVGRLVPALQQQNDIQSILSEQEMRGEDAEESKEEFDPQVQKHQRLAFDKHATYLIVGGLGGLGRSMATWMISHGARNLILLSRKGGDNMAVKSYIDEAKSRGVTIYAPSCDIADEVALNKALQYATNYLPPIKGCIQAAMVLQSAMFQNLTLQQWIDTLRPKVAGSLNLHKHLPTDLDFFILLSSVCGIVGASGQSNYAFACTYQDILARHKASLGQKAISIDLGIVAGVGYTSERQSIGSFMHSLGMQYISEEYLHGLLEYYCNKNRVIDSAQEAQIVVGIMTEKKLRQKGLVKPRFYSRPLFSHLSSRTRSVPRQVMQTAETSSKAVTEQPSAPTPTRSLPQGETQAMISKAICNRLSETLALSIDDIEPSKPLHAYGVDSLVAMEMRNWFREALHVDMVVFDILSNISIDGLAGKVITSRVAAGTQ